ncbi:hypothetical protein DFH08DRAFT_958684 [Mycena albidolilacea]|uniref:Uncharacterized protein n=1 Tax=Mycena albidolilacea TaxID=1033008 RepID=A0AAD7A5A2_9AGAR|nr:hypothetical protein DFH08DRAFT_958684 [Mycena albidolilacea]
MSAPKHSVHTNIPFVLLSTPSSAPPETPVGTELFNNPDAFKYDVPPYCLTDADTAPTPGRPLLMVYPDECGPSQIRVDVQSWPSFYFLAHPAIYRLLPFIWVPECINHMDPLIPAYAHTGWAAFVPLAVPATSPSWDTYHPLSVEWVFPSTEEFPEDQPLRNLLSINDHTTLLRIACPTLHFFTSFMAKGLALDSGGLELAVTLLDEAINPEYPIFEMIDNSAATKLV